MSSNLGASTEIVLSLLSPRGRLCRLAHMYATGDGLLPAAALITFHIKLQDFQEEAARQTMIRQWRQTLKTRYFCFGTDKLISDGAPRPKISRSVYRKILHTGFWVKFRRTPAGLACYPTKQEIQAAANLYKERISMGLFRTLNPQFPLRDL
jgi:hypothetical protein